MIENWKKAIVHFCTFFEVVKMLNAKGIIMKQNNVKESIECLLKNCPDVLTARKVVNWTPLEKNTVYDILKSGELPSIKYRGSYIISKADLIRYLVDHVNAPPKHEICIKEDMTDGH